MKQIGSLRLWPGRTYWHLDQERREGVVYIAREGFELPSIDPSALSY